MGAAPQARISRARFERQAMNRQLYADLPAELLEADDILRRYGRWARPHMIYETCGSAEGNYKAPPNDEDRLPSPPVLPPRENERARKALIGLPTMTRLIIQWLYVHPGSAQHYMRKHGLQPRHMRERHLSGVREFWTLYRSNENITSGTIAFRRDVIENCIT